MRGYINSMPRSSILAATGLALALLLPRPALAQAVNCTGINTMAPHNEAAEQTPPFEACEQIQGTEAVEDAALRATAARAQTAAIGALRSQSLAVTTAISDHIRALSRDLARGLAQS